ncbi:MAG: anthrax toxin lethal factor-related metalloendopeptidase [Limisphaerales bacterium]
MALISALTIVRPNSGVAAGTESSGAAKPKIILLNPPEQDFFSKELIFHGIPIKAPGVVADAAVYEAYNRVAMMLTNFVVKQPMLISNLVASGVELHIIGRHQVTSDLPEFRNLKGKHLPQYNGETIDQRTRGMGGRLSSVGEENLLKLKSDHYYGRDICVHEFAHAIRNEGLPRKIVARFNEQYKRSLAKGLWKGAYSASNPDEFFAELSMWYFGTHGDLTMTGPKPANGREGLRKYDPEAYALFDGFYSGRINIGKRESRRHQWTRGSNTNKPPITSK